MECLSCARVVFAVIQIPLPSPRFLLFASGGGEKSPGTEVGMSWGANGSVEGAHPG